MRMHAGQTVEQFSQTCRPGVRVSRVRVLARTRLASRAELSVSCVKGDRPTDSERIIGVESDLTVCQSSESLRVC